MTLTRRTIGTAVALSLAAALSLGSAAASAAEPPSAAGLAVADSVLASADPQAAYESLDAGDRAQFDAVEVPTSTTVEPSDGVLTSEDGTVTRGTI